MRKSESIARKIINELDFKSDSIIRISADTRWGIHDFYDKSVISIRRYGKKNLVEIEIIVSNNTISSDGLVLVKNCIYEKFKQKRSSMRLSIRSS